MTSCIQFCHSLSTGVLIILLIGCLFSLYLSLPFLLLFSCKILDRYMVLQGSAWVTMNLS
uniref:Uncharacterized protein n=1 Tax=Rhizophora mucronata TaxID=61149 RepID=A0A2P2QLI2_RHIMU